MTKEQEIAYRFLEARRRSASIEKYKLKKDKNIITYNVVEQYLKDSGEVTYELQKLIYTYQKVENGRTLSSLQRDKVPETFPEITKEVIDSVFVKIKEQSLEKFNQFFISYQKRLAETGQGSEERIKNALEDLKNAYSTYRKLNINGWNTPREQISISEMQNLYSLINPTNNDNKMPRSIEK